MPGGNGAAAASSVNQGATPTANAVGTTVTVSWTATTLASGQAVGGYARQALQLQHRRAADHPVRVHRHHRRPVVRREQRAGGSWKYTVTPKIGTNWLGQESSQSGTVTVTPPDTTRAGQRHHALVQRHRRRLPVGTTVYYRGVAAGSLHADQRGDRRRLRTCLEPDRDPRQHAHQLDPHRVDGVDARGRPLRLQHVQLDRGRDQRTHRGRDRARRRRQHRRHEPVVRQRLDRPERGHDQLPRTATSPATPSPSPSPPAPTAAPASPPSSSSEQSAPLTGGTCGTYTGFANRRSGQPRPRSTPTARWRPALLRVPLRGHRPGRQPAHRHQRQRRRRSTTPAPSTPPPACSATGASARPRPPSSPPTPSTAPQERS